MSGPHSTTRILYGCRPARPGGPFASWSFVGRGRNGDVYRAWDPSLDREVALKLIRSPSGHPLSEAGSVVEEGRLMARVRHPNVVTIYGAQTIDGRTGLWMEFIKGQTLETELRQQGPFDALRLTRVAVELGQALNAVHRAGLVHRDVKASNVLREADGHVVLGEFGTRRKFDEATIEGELAGTPAYLAPEVFKREPATPRSDLYSLAVLLFHLATGRFPVSGHSIRALSDAHAAGQRTHLRAERPDLPASITTPIDRALDPEPDRRFATAADMALAIAAGQTPGRSSWRRVGIAAAVLICAVGAAIAGLNRWSPRTGITDNPRDAVLITAFENAAGEPLLGSTLKYALERELVASRVFQLVSPERVGDVLELMSKPQGSPIDVTLAGDVVRRDGHIKAILVGRVDKDADAYTLVVRLENAGDGRQIAMLRQRASGPDDLLPAVRRLALGVRQALGESADSANQSIGVLARVTTPSLKALELYSSADALLRDGGPSKAAEAERLLREAVDSDPAFASAYLRLFRALVAQHGMSAEARDVLRVAFEKSAGTSRREQLLSICQASRPALAGAPPQQRVLEYLDSPLRCASRLVGQRWRSRRSRSRSDRR